MHMYDKKLKSYKSFTISWKLINKKPYLYPIPTLTLLKGKSTIFNLKLEIKNKPKKLALEFKDKVAEKYLALNTNEIGGIKVGKYDKHNFLKITCKENFSKEQILYVKADDEICGVLHIHPNDSNFQKKINIVIVNVTTNANGVEVTGAPIAKSIDFFRKCLNQALIVPNIKEELTALNCKGPYFQRRFCTIEAVGASSRRAYVITNSNGLRDYLEGMCSNQFGNKYDGYIKLFFIAEIADWNGFSYGNSKFGVYFNGHNRGTIAHETFHALSLPHTFASKNEDTLIAKYTYKAGQTNNKMDYSHQQQFGSIDRKFTYFWQWQILNLKLKR